MATDPQLPLPRIDLSTIVDVSLSLHIPSTSGNCNLWTFFISKFFIAPKSKKFYQHVWCRGMIPPPPTLSQSKTNPSKQSDIATTDGTFPLNSHRNLSSYTASANVYQRPRSKSSPT